MMRLRVLLPTHVLIDEQVKKITAEAEDGAFGILPRHIDFVTILVPGLFYYLSADDEPVYLAMADGVLVKHGFEVKVSARNAVRGDNLNTLWETVREEFQQLDDRERQARSVIAEMETTLARQIAELGGHEP